MIVAKEDKALLEKYKAPYNPRIYMITILAIICALFEAVNLGALVPLLQMINGSDNQGGNMWEILTTIFSFIGLELNFTNLLLLMAILFIIGQCLLFIKKVMQARLWFAFSSNLKRDLFSRSLNTDISYHHAQKAGNIIDLITKQSENGSNVVYTITEVYTYLFFIVIYTIMLLYISAQMTMVCAVIAILCFFFLNHYIAVSKQISATAVDVNQQMNAFVNERMHVLKLIKIFSTEKSEEAQFAKIRDSYAQANSDFMINGIRIETIFQVIIFLIAIIILYVSTVYLQMPLPLLLVFVFILIRLTDPLRQFNSQRHIITSQLESLKKVDELLTAMTVRQTISEGKKPFAALKGSLKVHNVSFSYDNNIPVLKGITFDLNKNEMVAFVGTSGGGKSTLVDLLIRLIEPRQGEILIDGINIKDFEIESYHKRIGFVSQDSYLMNDTILNNICYGSDRTTEEDAIRAAKQANAHDFILELPHGYATNIGEKGVTLSGGQKQRISLARALFKRPEILILDEATSALDSESEKIIQESISNLKNKVTIIAIAHRISTIRNSDKIIVIEKGTIVESGTHDKLIEKDGSYSNFFNIQYNKGDT